MIDFARSKFGRRALLTVVATVGLLAAFLIVMAPKWLLDYRVKQAVNAANQQRGPFFSESNSLPATGERTEARLFVEDWMDLAFDYWSDSADLSHRFARAMMSDEITDSFSSTFWSTKIEHGVARALVFQLSRCDVIRDNGSGVMDLRARGWMFTYDSFKDLEVSFVITVRNNGGKRVVDWVELDVPSTKVKSFVSNACRKSDVNISRQAILAYDEAVRHYVNSEDDACRASSDEVFQYAPRFARAYAYKGVWFHSFAEDHPELAWRYLAEARDAFSEALQIDSGAADRVLWVRYDCNIRLGDYGRAIDDCYLALAIHPNDPKFLTKRGTARYLIGNETAAVDDFEQAILRHPNYANAYAELGWVRWKQGLAGEALRLLDKSRALEPNGDALFYLGKIASEQKRYHDAIVLYSALEWHSSHRAECYFELARCYIALGDYEKAATNFEVGNFRQDATVKTLIECASIKFCQLHDLEGALKCLDRAVSFEFPYHQDEVLEATMMRADVLAALGRKDEARNVEEAIAKSKASCVHELKYRAQAKAHLEDFDGAIQDFTKAITSMRAVGDTDSPLLYSLYDGRRITRFHSGDLIGFMQDSIRCYIRRRN